jgi:hypothetical protein
VFASIQSNWHSEKAKTNITKSARWVQLCDFNFEIFEVVLGCATKTIENRLLVQREYSAS